MPTGSTGAVRSRRARLLAPLAVLLLAAPLTPPAAAAPDDPPSAGDLDRAERSVTSVEGQVAEIEAALAGASASLEAANIAAAQAAEAYNGAMWELDLARDEVLRFADAQEQAAADVERQRSGIVTLVTESYQNGTQLDTATALLSDQGPAGLMNRQAVVQSAVESMDAQFLDYRAASARAEEATAAAETAEERQQTLAAEAEQLAADAAGSAQAAATATAAVAAERERLITRLARVQQISVDLATRRQEALENAAREQATSQAAREAADLEVAASPQSARQATRQADQAPRPDPAPTPRPRPRNPAPAPPPPVPAPAPAPAPSGLAVQRAIAYAFAQVGKPYVWAAAGPDAFDCSGLTMQAWARGEKFLPHYSVAQYSMGRPVPVHEARAGDLLFWSDNGSPSGTFHVALALGGGRYIEAPRTGLDVRVSSFSYWYPTHAARL